MLAARDQENLVHGHQAAAASKSLNQGTRQLPPKTPAKAPKTPFKIPLNDENTGGIGGRTGGKTFGKGNENVMTGGKKGGLTDKFVTPMGPRSRAPLGMKTTNAKTKTFQTPAPPPADNDLCKPMQRSASARKIKPRVSHAEMTKLEVLGDKEDLEEPEIEYMPPRPKDMPDLPDDHWEPDPSIFENGHPMRGSYTYFMTNKDYDGLSHIEREQQAQHKLWDREMRKEDAKLQRDVDSMPIPCTHYPDCPGNLCKDTIEARKAAEEQYQKTIAEINAEAKPPPKKSVPIDASSALKSKAAATVLSKPKTPASSLKPTSKPGLPTAKPKLTSTLASRPKNAPSAPTNPSPMRYTAAVAASNTTMGYSKGRATSAALKKTGMPKREPLQPKKKSDIPDVSLCPDEYIERYGEPMFGTEMWLRCKRAGCFEKDEGMSLEEMLRGGGGGRTLDELLREGAEEEFQLRF